MDFSKRNMEKIEQKFEDCDCLTGIQKDTLIEFIRKREREECVKDKK